MANIKNDLEKYILLSIKIRMNSKNIYTQILFIPEILKLRF